jgi:hypothetical protein
MEINPRNVRLKDLVIFKDISGTDYKCKEKFSTFYLITLKFRKNLAFKNIWVLKNLRLVENTFIIFQDVELLKIASYCLL